MKYATYNDASEIVIVKVSIGWVQPPGSEIVNIVETMRETYESL